MAERLGFTKFPNDLIERLVKSRLSSLELRLALYLWRTTEGYEFKGVRQTERVIGLTEWSKSTNSKKPHVSTALKGLAARRVIRRQYLGAGKGYSYSLNMPEEWLAVTK